MAGESTSRRVPFRNPLADTQDQILFFLCFVAGSVAIWTLKLAHLSQWIVTIVPLGLMGLYAGIALVTKRYRLREDKVGDNIYYLGFLFTLVSLSYALYVYRPDGSGATDIITNFGIAIFTTIVGLAGRVFFNQMREDPVEYEREARYSLAEASSSMKAQLGDIATEMSSFKRKLMQIMEEGVTEITNNSKNAMTANAAEFSRAASEVMSAIQQAFGTFTGHSEKLSILATKNVAALEALFERIEKIEASPDLVASKIEPVVAKFDEVASESLKRSRGHANDLKRLKEVIEASLDAAATIKATIDESHAPLRGEVEALANVFRESGAAARGLAESLKGMSDGLTAEVVNNRAALERARASLVEETAAARASLATLHELIETERGVNRDAAAAFRREIANEGEAHRLTVAELKKTMAADIEAARSHQREVAGLVAECRSMTAELEKALVSMSQAIVTKLNGS